MKINTISYFMLVLFLTQSCVVYQKTAVSLREAEGKGKVKITNINGKPTYLSEISKDSTGYYGYQKGTRFGIDSTISRAIYLRKAEEFRAFKIWLELNNNSKVKGILYGVSDSSIWVIKKDKFDEIKDYFMGQTLYKQDYLKQAYNKDEYMAKDILKIKLRKEYQPSTFGRTGIGIGAGIGFIAGFAMDPAGGEYRGLFGIIGASLGLSIGAITGLIVGTKKTVYIIHGDLDNFKVYQDKLKAYSIFK